MEQKTEYATIKEDVDGPFSYTKFVEFNDGSIKVERYSLAGLTIYEENSKDELVDYVFLSPTFGEETRLENSWKIKHKKDLCDLLDKDLKEQIQRFKPKSRNY